MPTIDEIMAIPAVQSRLFMREHEELRSAIKSAIREARAAERERAINFVEAYSNQPHVQAVAKAIRALKD